MNNHSDHHRYMQLAIEESAKGDAPFGAVIVKNHTIIVSGHNQSKRKVDCTAHAELVVIRKAQQVLNTTDLSQCSIYASAEPCPMCASAIAWSGISTVYFGASIPALTNIGMHQIGIRSIQIFDSWPGPIEVHASFMEKEALEAIMKYRAMSPKK